MAPWPVKKIIKKMAAKGGHIDFMFLAPLTRPLDPLLGSQTPRPYLPPPYGSTTTFHVKVFMFSVVSLFWFLFLFLGVEVTRWYFTNDKRNCEGIALLHTPSQR